MTRHSAPPLAAVFLVVLFLAPTVVRAQYTGSNKTTYDYEGTASRSLSVGASTIDAAFGESGDGRIDAVFDGDTGLGFRIAGKTAALTAAYASGEGDAEAAIAELSFGPRITPFAIRDTKWVAVHLPVKFSFGYAYLHPQSENLPVPTVEDAAPYHIGRAGLGLGLGLEGGLSLEGKAAREVSGAISYVLTPGATSDVSADPFETVRAQRSAEFNIEVRATKVGGSGIGLVIGYTRQITLVSDTEIEEIKDVIDAISASGFAEQTKLGLLRIGLAF